MHLIRSYPIVWRTWLTFGLISAVCLQIPLFNILDYEYAFVFTLAFALAAPGIAYRLAKQQRPRWLVYATLGGAFCLVLGMGLLASFWVTNCNLPRGVLFFVLLPGIGTLYGASLGHILGKYRFSVVWVFVLCLFPLFETFWTLYTHPPIFAFDHLWGFFPGSIYDETIAIDDRLWKFRSITGLRATLLFFLAYGSKFLTRARSQSPWLHYPALIAIAALLWAIDLSAGGRMGYATRRSHVLQALPTTVVGDGFVLHFPPKTRPKAQQSLARAHAFWLNKYRHLFPNTGSKPRVIHSYIYKDSAMKARFIGAANTMLAKPWLGEIHIHGLGYPHPTLGHELVHALAAPWGSPPFSVTARGYLWVQLAWIEGLAQALTPPQGLSDLHTQARSLRKLGYLRPLESILDPIGFWRQQPRRAYAQVGSFIAYLIDRFGTKPLRLAYAHGDIHAAYGPYLDSSLTAERKIDPKKPGPVDPQTYVLRKLEHDWLMFLDTQEPSEREHILHVERFSIRSLFDRTCSHEIAELRQKARRATADKAPVYTQKVLKHRPNNAAAWVAHILALMHAERWQELADTVYAHFGTYHPQWDPDRSPFFSRVQWSQIQQALGNKNWHASNIQEARKHFAAAASIPLSPASERLQYVRLWALDPKQELWRPQLRQFFAGKLSSQEAYTLLQKGHTAHPSDPTWSYLFGRRLFSRAHYQQALKVWRTSNKAHPQPMIEAERIRMQAHALRHLNRYPEAIKKFQAYAEAIPLSGEQARAKNWIERLLFDPKAHTLQVF